MDFVDYFENFCALHIHPVQLCFGLSRGGARRYIKAQGGQANKLVLDSCNASSSVNTLFDFFKLYFCLLHWCVMSERLTTIK